MTQSRFLRNGLCLVAGLAGLLVLSAAPARADVLKIATLAPEGSSWMRVLDSMGREINKRTEGRVKLRFYWGGSAGDERDAVRKLGHQLQGVVVTSIGLGMIQPAVRILEVPFLIRNYGELDYVRKKLSDTFAKTFEDKGYVFLGWGEVGFVHLFSNAPFNSRADIANSKIWAWVDDALTRALFNAMGVSGVPLGVPDVLASLQTGVINAAYGSPYSMIALQWHSKVKFMTAAKVSIGIGATVVTKKAFDKLTPGDQAIVRELAFAAADKLVGTIRRDNQSAEAELSRAGIQTVQTPPALLGELHKAANQVKQQMIGKLYPASLLQQVEQALTEYRNGAR
jgi:TRAP-type C4-dicarboxylate transport system substrate-binding protein